MRIIQFFRNESQFTNRDKYACHSVRKEICQRIIVSARHHKTDINHQAEINAMLDALATVVDMSRGRMEEILEEVL